MKTEFLTAKTRTTTFRGLVAIVAITMAAACATRRAPAEAPQSEAAPEGGMPQQQQPYAQPPPAQAEQAPSAAPAAPESAYPGTTRAEEADEAEAADRSQRSVEELSRDLDRALSLSVPDCTQAALLRDQICDLAERICRLAGRNSGEQELARRCGDARSSCERAGQRVRHSCP